MTMQKPTPQKPTHHKPTIVTLTTSSILRNRVHQAVLAQGGRSIVVSNETDFRVAVDGYYPVLIFVDLYPPDVAGVVDRIVDEDIDGVKGIEENERTQPVHDREVYVGLIERCKLLPHTRAISIVAIDNKTTEPKTHRTEADLTLDRKTLWSQLSQIIDEQINPPIRYVEGWDDLLPTDARKGLEEFNCGKYFEQHESLEIAWIAETRDIREMYQGILQTGVALLQIERGNWAGAVKLFRRGLPKLRSLPPKCQGISLAEFFEEMQQIHDEISLMGAEKLPDFDQNRFPKIDFE